MIVNIDKEIVLRYRSLGLSLDFMGSVMIVLIGLYEKDYDLLDSIDDGNKERRMLMLYHYLDRKGLIESDKHGDALYTLTERGMEFVSSISKPVDASASECLVRVEDPAIPSVGKEDVSGWIVDWINLFPGQKVNGRYLRTDKEECLNRMRWFTKNYLYDKKTIFEATKLYIDTQESSPSGHTYTRNSSYFIYKGRDNYDRISDLATWCSRVLDGDIRAEESFNRDVI